MSRASIQEQLDQLVAENRLLKAKSSITYIVCLAGVFCFAASKLTSGNQLIVSCACVLLAAVLFTWQPVYSLLVESATATAKARPAAFPTPPTSTPQALSTGLDDAAILAAVTSAAPRTQSGATARNAPATLKHRSVSSSATSASAAQVERPHIAEPALPQTQPIAAVAPITILQPLAAESAVTATGSPLTRYRPPTAESPATPYPATTAAEQPSPAAADVVPESEGVGAAVATASAAQPDAVPRAPSPPPVPPPAPVTEDIAVLSLPLPQHQQPQQPQQQPQQTQQYAPSSPLNVSGVSSTRSLSPRVRLDNSPPTIMSNSRGNSRPPSRSSTPRQLTAYAQQFAPSPRSTSQMDLDSLAYAMHADVEQMAPVLATASVVNEMIQQTDAMVIHTRLKLQREQETLLEQQHQLKLQWQAKQDTIDAMSHTHVNTQKALHLAQVAITPPPMSARESAHQSALSSSRASAQVSRTVSQPLSPRYSDDGTRLHASDGGADSYNAEFVRSDVQRVTSNRAAAFVRRHSRPSVVQFDGVADSPSSYDPEAEERAISEQSYGATGASFAATPPGPAADSSYRFEFRAAATTSPGSAFSRRRESEHLFPTYSSLSKRHEGASPLIGSHSTPMRTVAIGRRSFQTPYHLLHHQQQQEPSQTPEADPPIPPERSVFSAKNYSRVPLPPDPTFLPPHLVQRASPPAPDSTGSRLFTTTTPQRRQDGLKQHQLHEARADVGEGALEVAREAGLQYHRTYVPFANWTPAAYGVPAATTTVTATPVPTSANAHTHPDTATSVASTAKSAKSQQDNAQYERRIEQAARHVLRASPLKRASVSMTPDERARRLINVSPTRASVANISVGSEGLTPASRSRRQSYVPGGKQIAQFSSRARLSFVRGMLNQQQMAAPAYTLGGQLAPSQSPARTPHRRAQSSFNRSRDESQFNTPSRSFSSVRQRSGRGHSPFNYTAPRLASPTRAQGPPIGTYDVPSAFAAAAVKKPGQWPFTRTSKQISDPPKMHGAPVGSYDMKRFGEYNEQEDIWY
eukprot:TRINITY_DN5034_c0_g1_i1.p1 TRINITY_DN5034_c0_g1~~TRINITY_DN5034_c0_g1_i1.p1  ORF type:complete len:1064 (+),score=236.06 TRINITY_DN5034_c0_g1_i1:94-3192(+)